LPVEVVAGSCLEGIDEIEHIDEDGSIVEGAIGGVVISDEDGLGRHVDVAGKGLRVGGVDAGEGGVSADGDKLGGQRDDDDGVGGHWLDGEVEFEIDGVVLPVNGEAVGRRLVDLRARSLHVHAHVATLAGHQQPHQEKAQRQRDASAWSQIM
jgi:hypothetical protein